MEYDSQSGGKQLEDFRHTRPGFPAGKIIVGDEKCSRGPVWKLLE